MKVAEVKQRDAGKGNARINAVAMKTLGVVAGDIIEIAGNRTTAAIAWPAYPENQQLNIICIDGLVRKNAGVALDDSVKVRKAKVSEAKSIVLEPTDIMSNISSDFEVYAKARLTEQPLVQGDNIFILTLGGGIPFTVKSTEPQGIVKVSPNTKVEVLAHSEGKELRVKDITDVLDLFFAIMREHEKRLDTVSQRLETLANQIEASTKKLENLTEKSEKKE